MGQMSEETRRELQECGCSEADIAQIASLCSCGCADEAVLRLRCHRARLMEDLHERQARVDLLDTVVRRMRSGA